MKRYFSLTNITLFVFSVLLILFGFFLIKLYYQEQELRNLLIEKQDHKTVSPIIEKLVSGQSSWGSLQHKVKDTVVQLFASRASQDLLQPYQTPAQQQCFGSGFFINDQGEIITNAHVISQAKVHIQIPSLGKRQIDVDIIGVSPDRDLALLRIKPDELEDLKKDLGGIKYLPFGDSDLVHRADEVMALGYPLGTQSLKSTTGVVSGREQHWIQIDAAINPGNSGGPSVNLKGEVVGINTAIIADAQNIGYIIPINDLKIVLDDLRKFPLLKSPYLGIMYIKASEALTKHLGNPSPGGAYVVAVYNNSPMGKAGLKKGDMIYEINGHKLDVYGELLWNEDRISIVDYVSQLRIGQEIKIVAYRQGERKEFVFIFQQPDPLPVDKIYLGYEKIDYEIIAGMVVQPLKLNHLPLLVNAAPSLTKYAHMKYQMKPALIITHIFPNSQVSRARSIFPGCILDKINGKKIKTMDEFRTAIFESLKTNIFTIETKECILVVLPIEKIINEDPLLAQDYFYAVTPATQALITKFNQAQKQECTALKTDKKEIIKQSTVSNGVETLPDLLNPVVNIPLHQ